MRKTTLTLLLGSLIAAALLLPLLEGCGAASLFYLNKKTQAIQRDTISASGGVTSFLQNPADKVNGVVRLAPVESMGLQPVALEIPASEAKGVFKQPRTVMLPPGFKASVVAAGLGRVHDLAVREDGTIFFSDIGGKIIALQQNGTQTTLDEGLNSPHGIEFVNGSLFYTDENHIFRYDFSGATSVTGQKSMLTDKLPSGGTNYTRTIRWSAADKRFYIAVGSTTNKNPEPDNQTATVLRVAEKGGKPDVAVYGGLRNTVAMDINPESGEIWGIDNGTELLSPFLPPTEVNIIKVGRFYGWPYFYSQNFRDPEYTDADTIGYPKNPVPSIIDLESHADALDMQFYTGNALGSDWHNAALVTLHGLSKVIRLRAASNGSNARQADFMTGFIDAEGSVWGQPVGVAFAPDGRTIYISDDRAGAIYKVVKQ